MNAPSMHHHIQAPKLWSWERQDPIAPAIKVGNLIFVAGQIALDPDGNLVGRDDLAVQANRCFQNIQEVLARLGAGMSDVVKLTTYFSGHLDEGRARDYWGVRERYFGPNGPASTGVLVAGLILPDCLLEIEAIAVVNNKDQPN